MQRRDDYIALPVFRASDESLEHQSCGYHAADAYEAYDPTQPYERASNLDIRLVSRLNVI